MSSDWVGALFAMGRTCSTSLARPTLGRAGERDDSECVYEAIRACGQIQLKEAARRVSEFTLSEDQEITNDCDLVAGRNRRPARALRVSEPP